MAYWCGDLKVLVAVTRPYSTYNSLAQSVLKNTQRIAKRINRFAYFHVLGPTQLQVRQSEPFDLDESNVFPLIDLQHLYSVIGVLVCQADCRLLCVRDDVIVREDRTFCGY